MGIDSLLWYRPEKLGPQIQRFRKVWFKKIGDQDIYIHGKEQYQLNVYQMGSWGSSKGHCGKTEEIQIKP